MENVDKAYLRYHTLVNMSYSELLAWSKNPCSRKASLDTSPIKRNLHLLSTPKYKWRSKEVGWANRTISFISRMRANPNGAPVCGGLSKRQISLRNWAYWD